MDDFEFKQRYGVGKAVVLSGLRKLHSVRPRDTVGICANLMMLVKGVRGFAFVCDYAEGWPLHSDNYDFPIDGHVVRPGPGKWVDEALIRRRSLIRYLIKRLKSNEHAKI